MFALKRTAFRLISSPSFTSQVTASRSLSTASPFSLRQTVIKPTTSTLLASRRWNSTQTPESADKQEATTIESAIESVTEAQGSTTANDASLDDIAAEQASKPIESDPIAAADSISAQTEEIQAPRVTEEAPVSGRQPRERREPRQRREGDRFGNRREGDRYANRRDARPPRANDSNGPNAQGDKRTPKATIYVGNLFFDITADDLKKELEKVGTVLSTRLIYDSRGLSRGYGYVTFDSVDSAAKAIEQYHLQYLEGRRIVVDYAVTEEVVRSRFPSSNTIFVGNMAYEMTDRDLRDLFRDIKGIVDVRVAVDRRTGQPRGFSHAQFENEELAAQGIEDLRHKLVYGRRLKLDFSTPSRQIQKTPRDDSVAGEASADAAPAVTDTNNPTN